MEPTAKELEHERCLKHPTFPRSQSDLIGLLAYMAWRHAVSITAPFEQFEPDNPHRDHQWAKDRHGEHLLSDDGNQRRQCGGDFANFARFLSELWRASRTEAMEACYAAYRGRLRGIDAGLPVACDHQRHPRLILQWMQEQKPVVGPAVHSGAATANEKRDALLLAIEKLGKTAKSVAVIAEAGVGKKNGLDILRELETEGSFDGFTRKRNARYKGS